MKGEDLSSIMSELLLQKSLLTEDAKKYAEIDRYLSIAQSIPEADHHSIKDPFDRSIAIVFELIMNNNLDPNSIDIVAFSRLYTERVKADRNVNFIVAGRLIFMAWSILRLESDLLLSSVKADQEVADLDPDSFYMFDEDPAYYLEGIELQPAVRSNVRRAVSIMDLLDAFAQAQHEIERHLSRAAAPQPVHVFNDNAHKEDPERELSAVMERIAALGPGPVAFSDIARNRDEEVTVFLYMLFLCRLGRIRAWQEGYPDGEIFMEIAGGDGEMFVELAEAGSQEM